jgi:hypothetical protein
MSSVAPFTRYLHISRTRREPCEQEDIAERIRPRSVANAWKTQKEKPRQRKPRLAPGFSISQKAIAVSAILILLSALLAAALLLPALTRFLRLLAGVRFLAALLLSALLTALVLLTALAVRVLLVHEVSSLAPADPEQQK